MHPAAFLDRDDTIIRRKNNLPTGDLGDPDDIELIPGAAEALTRLRNAGYHLVVFTNQGGVARGRYTEHDVNRVHHRLDQLLLAAGVPPSTHPEPARAAPVRTPDGRTEPAPPVAIDAYRFCPYHPRGALPAYTREHPWRKPAPGMLLDAIATLRLDPAKSIAIGDQPRDLEAATAAGVPRGRCRLLAAAGPSSRPAPHHPWPAAPSVTAAVHDLLADMDF